MTTSGSHTRAVGDVAEMCVSLGVASGDTLLLEARLNAGTTYSANTAIGFATSRYSEATLYPNAYAAVSDGNHYFRDIVICRGTHTLADFAALVA